MSSLSKVILVLGKVRISRAPNLGYSGAELPGCFDISPKNCAWDMVHEQACCDKAANDQLPIAAGFWTIQIVSMEECSSLTQNLMQIHCSTCSVILNVMATQYTCSLNSVYCPHWLVQWSHHCSCMQHSSPLSLAARFHQCCANHSHYINNDWTFPERPHIFGM